LDDWFEEGTLEVKGKLWWPVVVVGGLSGFAKVGECRGRFLKILEWRPLGFWVVSAPIITDVIRKI
jgi:hypothetical protein